MEDWQRRPLSLNWLRRKAFDARDERNVFGWLKAIGVVPQDVKALATAKPRLDMDPENIPAGYLARCAFEWDSWGESSPVDFVDAMAMEMAKEPKRDFVAALLTLLGREPLAEAA